MSQKPQLFQKEKQGQLIDKAGLVLLQSASLELFVAKEERFRQEGPDKPGQ